ncbi:hypothetical protein [Clostridium sp. ZS1]|uniref:hypothetical protein n=1 Tax=Clostridium sp. ZS1 TaxID=2949989 RepID=UPI001DC62580|nr:hypothetical protein [Clostridium sp. ZS1]MBN1037749.1 hypothetical protein [Clostridium botulinum]MBN1067015.1 hypothetical protein [Clostridium botulinum]
MERREFYSRNVKKNNTINLNQYKKQKIKKRKKRTLVKRYICTFFILVTLVVSSFIITKEIYIQKRCADLAYSVEHYFTNGFDKKNKLLRVQQMSLIYSDGENALVEASGLSKKEPHKQTILKGNFKKDKSNFWVLDEVYN